MPCRPTPRTPPTGLMGKPFPEAPKGNPFPEPPSSPPFKAVPLRREHGASMQALLLCCCVGGARTCTLAYLLLNTWAPRVTAVMTEVHNATVFK